MNRNEELEFMLKGAEVNVLYACKDVCDNGLTSDTIVRLDYAITIYHSIHNSLADYKTGDEPENSTEGKDSHAEE